jgi:signal transduction histidine kinase/CheY-like chemotaxis protein
MGEPRMAALRAALGRRVARHTFIMAILPYALTFWQMGHAGSAAVLVGAVGVGMGLCAAAAFLDVSPRVRIAFVLGGLTLVPVSSAAYGTPLPGVVGGSTLVWLLAAFLVGPRGALAMGLFLEVVFLLAGVAHRGDPALAEIMPFMDVLAGRNWVRTGFTLLALTAISVPAIVGHLHALADATARSEGLLAAAEVEERLRSEATAARVRADAERRENARLNLLDMVGDGFAQRCGNLLQVVSNEVDRLRAASTGADRAAVRDRLSDMAEAVGASAAILRRLVAMNGEAHPPALEPMDLGEFAQAACSQLGSVKGIETVARVQQGLRVLADASSLHAVVLNLGLNARDAMPHGGRLTLTARASTAAEAATTGCSAALDVADTGSGMDEATLARLFQPFFTTKGAGGTGLGLNAARRVLEAAGAHITVASAPAKGTTFTLLLPGAPEAPSHTRQVLPTVAAPSSGACVLLVDDNAAARQGWAAALHERGFVVHQADSVDSALAVARSAPIAMAWIDPAMPGRPAHELIDTLRRTQPRARLVVCSVLGVDHLAQGELAATDVEWVPKPCSLSALLERAERAATRIASHVPHT